MNPDPMDLLFTAQTFAKAPPSDPAGNGAPVFTPEMEGTLKLTSGRTDVVASFDPKHAPISIARVRDSVGMWASNEGTSLAEGDSEIYLWPEPEGGRAFGQPMRVRTSTTGSRKLVCANHAINETCPVCESMDAKSAALLSVKYNSIDFEDKLDGLVNRLRPLAPIQLWKRVSCWISFGVPLNSRKVIHLLQESGVPVITRYDPGMWPGESGHCYVDGSRGHVGVVASSGVQLREISSEIAEVIVRHDCAQRVVPRICGRCHHQLDTSFGCQSLPIQRLKERFETLGYVVTLTNYDYPSGEEVSLRFCKRNLENTQPNSPPSVDCHLTNYPRDSRSRLTIYSSSREQALRSREEINEILADMNVVSLKDDEPPEEANALPVQAFHTLPWKTKFSFDTNVRLRLDILQEIAQSTHWDVSVIAPQYPRLEQKDIGIAWMAETGYNQMVEVGEEHINVNIVLEELFSLLEKTQLVAYAEHDFIRQFVSKYGHDLEIIGRAVLGKVARLVALWRTKQVLVLAETTYRFPRGRRNRWEGVYYFSPRRKSIRRFLEILKGATTLHDEKRIANFVDSFSETQKRKMAERLTKAYIS